MTDDQIVGLRAIANYLNVSVRHVQKLLKADVADSLSRIVLEKKIRKVCRDGKIRYFKVKYTLGKLLDMWQWRRGGLKVEKRDEEL